MLVGMPSTVKNWRILLELSVTAHKLIATTTTLHPFYGPLSGTTQVSRYQKDKPFSILLKQTWWGGSGIS